MPKKAFWTQLENISSLPAQTKSAFQLCLDGFSGGMTSEGLHMTDRYTVEAHPPPQFYYLMNVVPMGGPGIDLPF